MFSREKTHIDGNRQVVNRDLSLGKLSVIFFQVGADCDNPGCSSLMCDEMQFVRLPLRY